MNRLDQKYRETVVPALMKKFEYKSVMEVPCIDKVVINMGVGDAIANSKALDDAVAELAAITGQAPVITRAKKSIANFKVREGFPIRLSTDAETTRWASRNRSSSRKSITIRSTRYAAWTSSSSRLRRPTKRQGHCWQKWACLSRNKEDLQIWQKKQ